MGAEMCDSHPATSSRLGAGPVGQFAMDSARLFGAGPVIAIDKEPYRLAMAEEAGPYPDQLHPGGRAIRTDGADRRPGTRPSASRRSGWKPRTAARRSTAYDRAKQATEPNPNGRTPSGRRSLCCRNGGVVSVIGDYGGLADKLPAGSWMNRSLTLADRPVPCSALHEAAAGTIRTRRDRPDAGHHAQAAAASAHRIGYDMLQAQAGRLREGRSQARRPCGCGSLTWRSPARERATRQRQGPMRQLIPQERREWQTATLAAPRRRYGPDAKSALPAGGSRLRRARTLSKFRVSELVARTPHQSWGTIGPTACRQAAKRENPGPAALPGSQHLSLARQHRLESRRASAHSDHGAR